MLPRGASCDDRRVAKIDGTFLIVFVIIIVYAVGELNGQSSASCVTPDGNTGTCVVLSTCTHVKSLLQKAHKPLSAEDRRLILEYRCEARSKLPKVCCPIATGEPPSIARHRHLALLPSECAEALDSKIISYGGNSTELYEFPFMALIATVENGVRRFTCGGTIINSRYILTAAHCITNIGDKTIAGVRVGEHDYSTPIDCQGVYETDQLCAPPVQDFIIEKIIPHEGYVGVKAARILQVQHDIGLIRLRGQIDLSKFNAVPVCLPRNKELQEYRLDGEVLVLPGWGVTETQKYGSSKLLKIRVPIVPNQRCGEIYNRSIADGVGFRQMCAGGEKGISSCSADSGGPLVLDVIIDGVIKNVQFGIVSVGSTRCGQKGAPTVFTRVAHYMDWILNNLEP